MHGATAEVAPFFVLSVPPAFHVFGGAAFEAPSSMQLLRNVHVR